MENKKCLKPPTSSGYPKKIDDNLETWKSGTHHRTNILEPLFGIFWVTLMFNPIEIYTNNIYIYIFIYLTRFGIQYLVGAHQYRPILWVFTVEDIYSCMSVQSFVVMLRLPHARKKQKIVSSHSPFLVINWGWSVRLLWFWKTTTPQFLLRSTPSLSD